MLKLVIPAYRKHNEDAKKQNNTITLDNVKQWMNKQPNKQIRPYKGHNSWVAPYARFEYQIDIMDMNSLKYDYIYAIVVIDAFSKLADAEPMNDKQTNTVYQSLLNIFQKMGYPSSTYSDGDGTCKDQVKYFRSRKHKPYHYINSR